MADERKLNEQPSINKDYYYYSVLELCERAVFQSAAGAARLLQGVCSRGVRGHSPREFF